jgi:hypothetical protein
VIWVLIALVLAILFAARTVYNGLRAHAAVMFEGMIRSAFVANFSRFGDFDDYRIAVIDDKRGYFVRDNALWMVEVEDEELVKSTARPIDLMTVDAELLKEAMAAVDTLHSDFKDMTEDDE